MYCPACHTDYPSDWKTCPKDSTTLLKSAHIGKYLIEGLLGVGGMGAVYRAKNPDTGAAVAIKVMNREVAVAQDARERFKREAGVVSRLDTAHVCKVYDFGAETDGTLYLVMELMKGHTLREEITPSPGHMDLARVQMVMTGALKGLAAAHAGGIVHRDLKPENIFVADTYDGEVPKLLDFGIARVTSSKDENLTRTGTMMGTASYMAPEQVTGATSQMGPWTDVYAMGAILYEMLAGAPAFGGSTLSEVLHRVMQGEAVALSTVRGGLPDAIYTLVERCLSVDIGKRPQDADAMRRELAAANLSTSTTVPPPSKTGVDTSKAAVAETIGVDVAVPIVPVPPANPPPGSPAVAVFLPVSERTTEPIPKTRSLIPVVAIGVVAVGVVVLVIAIAGNRDAKPEPVVAPLVDAALVVVPDAAIDAEVVAPPVETSVECPAGMIHIPPATFMMGSPDGAGRDDEHPAHRVTLSGYCIDKTEVTVAAYAACVVAHGCAPMPLTVHSPASKYNAGVTVDQARSSSELCNRADRKTHPVNCVDWAQSKAYCAWASKRLPTEAEWEYAARGSDGRRYPWGNASPTNKHLNWKSTTTRPVGSFPDGASPFGVLDMAGNVDEWTGDYDGPYTSGAQTNPTGATSNDQRIRRGGSLSSYDPDGPNSDIRATFRDRAEPDHRYFDQGFRCARGDADAKTTNEAAAATRPEQLLGVLTAPNSKPTCDPTLFKTQGRAKLDGGDYAGAMAAVDRALACKPDRELLGMAFLSACKLSDAERAHRYWKRISPRRDSGISGAEYEMLQVCRGNGIDPN